MFFVEICINKQIDNLLFSPSYNHISIAFFFQKNKIIDHLKLKLNFVVASIANTIKHTYDSFYQTALWQFYLPNL